MSWKAGRQIGVAAPPHTSAVSPMELALEDNRVSSQRAKPRASAPAMATLSGCFFNPFKRLFVAPPPPAPQPRLDAPPPPCVSTNSASTAVSLRQASVFVALAAVPMCVASLLGDIAHTNAHFDSIRGDAHNVLQMVSAEDKERFLAALCGLREHCKGVHEVFLTATSESSATPHTWGLEKLPDLNFMLVTCMQAPIDKALEVSICRTLSRQNPSARPPSPEIEDHTRPDLASRKPWLKLVDKIENSTRKVLELRDSQLKVNAMHGQLETKRTFVRYVSHEIRTPLNVVLSGLELLERSTALLTSSSTAAEVGVDCAELITDSKNACIIAIDILNDLLLYEKLDSDILVLDKKRCNVMDVVKATVSLFSIQAASLGVQLCLTSLLPSQPCILEGDANKLSQVFRNLLSNALKFSPSGGVVDVCVSLFSSAAPDRLDHVRVTVQDAGPGMPIASRARLFNEIVQFDAAALQEGGGSGLGLYLTRGIVQLHGGRIGVDMDWAGPGSIFYVELPVCVGAQPSTDIDHAACIASSDTPSLAPPSNRMLTVLLVDDALLCRKLHRKILAPFCKVIVEAVNGQEAVDVMRDYMSRDIRIDAVIMDSCMTVMCGPAATSALRELGYTGKVIGVTGNGFQTDIDDFLTHGADDVLVKPVALAAFEDMLARIR